MRALLLMFAAAAVGLACEKDAALSKSTNSLAPAQATAPETSALKGAAPPSSVPEESAAGGVAAATPSPAAPSTAAPSPAEPGSAAKPATTPLEASARHALEPARSADEGNGEPMDDVDDDEAVPATDKSGVDEPVDDDSEGVGIDIRQ